MRRRKEHAGQLTIDFSIPAIDPLNPKQIAEALWTSERMTVSRVYELIDEGKIGAVDVSSDSAERAEYRIPLTNFIHYLNKKYGDNLYWRFPNRDKCAVKQIADNLNLSQQSIHNKIADGEFPHAINLGRQGKRTHWQIPIVDLVNFVNRNRVGAFC